MRLYLLRPSLTAEGQVVPEMRECRSRYAILVRAGDEEQARRMVSKLQGNSDVWLRSDCTTCVQVLAEGLAEIILEKT